MSRTVIERFSTADLWATRSRLNFFEQPFFYFALLREYNANRIILCRRYTPIMRVYTGVKVYFT